MSQKTSKNLQYGIKTIPDIIDDITELYQDVNSIPSPAGNYLPLSGGSLTGNVKFTDGKGIFYGSSVNGVYFDEINQGFGPHTGTTINAENGSAYALIGTRYDGGVELGAMVPNAVLGLYTNTGSMEIYDAYGIVINDGNRVEIGVDSKEEITLADNTSASKTSTNVDKKAVIIGSKNSTVNSGIINSVVIGGSSLTASKSNYLYTSNVNIKNLATYADNTGALAGGLVAGDLYRTSTGVLMITY